MCSLVLLSWCRLERFFCPWLEEKMPPESTHCPSSYVDSPILFSLAESNWGKNWEQWQPTSSSCATTVNDCSGRIQEGAVWLPCSSCSLLWVIRTGIAQQPGRRGGRPSSNNSPFPNFFKGVFILAGAAEVGPGPTAILSKKWNSQIWLWNDTLFIIKPQTIHAWGLPVWAAKVYQCLENRRLLGTCSLAILYHFCGKEVYSLCITITNCSF